MRKPHPIPPDERIEVQRGEVRHFKPGWCSDCEGLGWFSEDDKCEACDGEGQQFAENCECSGCEEAALERVVVAFKQTSLTTGFYQVHHYTGKPCPHCEDGRRFHQVWLQWWPCGHCAETGDEIRWGCECRRCVAAKAEKQRREKAEQEESDVEF